MAQILTPERILEIAKASQYITGNNVATETFFKGGSLNRRLDILIYMERKGIQYQFDKNPALGSLRETANYLFSILGYKNQAQTAVNNQTQSPPSITNPSNQSVDVGENAVFSTTATSDLPVTYQWLLNGSPIVGATSSTYTVTSAQLSDSGNEYSVTVTNAVGSVTSSPATLTVSAAITGSYFFGDVDHFADLNNGIDNISYNGTFSITDGQPLVVNFTSGAQNNKYNGIKYPIGQGTKTLWENVPLNAGSIPDSVMRSTITIGAYLYVISRVAMSLDSSNQTITYS